MSVTARVSKVLGLGYIQGYDWGYGGIWGVSWGKGNGYGKHNPKP